MFVYGKNIPLDEVPKETMEETAALDVNQQDTVLVNTALFVYGKDIPLDDIP